MTSNTDLHLLTKIAVLYYEHQLSQQEIGRRLGLSRQTVGRLLKRSADVGIVRLEIHSSLSHVSELELGLEQAFELLEVVAVSLPTNDEDSIKRAIGQVGAEFLQRRVRNGDILGVVSGSTTVYQCAVHLRPSHLPDLTVVSLTGSGPRSPSPMPTEPIAYWVGKALGGKTVLLPAPAFVDRADIKQSLLSDSNIADIIQLGHRTNIAVVGVGVISEEASPYQQGFVDRDLLETMKRENCVGEICGHAYNLHGEICSPELSARTIGIDLSNLRSKELSVALAGGLNKLDAIWGGLQGHYFNVLITDENTAQALLERKSDEQSGRSSSLISWTGKP